MNTQTMLARFLAASITLMTLLDMSSAHQTTQCTKNDYPFKSTIGDWTGRPQLVAFSFQGVVDETHVNDTSIFDDLTNGPLACGPNIPFTFFSADCIKANLTLLASLNSNASFIEIGVAAAHGGSVDRQLSCLAVNGVKTVRGSRLANSADRSLLMEQGITYDSSMESSKLRNDWPFQLSKAVCECKKNFDNASDCSVSATERDLIEIGYSSTTALTSANQYVHNFMQSFNRNYQQQRAPVVLALTPLIRSIGFQATRVLVQKIMSYHDVVAVQHQQLAMLTSSTLMIRSQQNDLLGICTESTLQEVSPSQVAVVADRMKNQLANNQNVDSNVLRQAIQRSLTMTTTTKPSTSTSTSAPTTSNIVSSTSTSVPTTSNIVSSSSTSAPTTSNIVLTTTTTTPAPTSGQGAGGDQQFYSSFEPINGTTSAPDSSSIPVFIPIMLSAGGLLCAAAVFFAYRTYSEESRTAFVNSGPAFFDEDRDVYDLEDGESMRGYDLHRSRSPSSSGSITAAQAPSSRISLSAEMELSRGQEPSNAGTDYSATFPSFLR